MLCVCVCVCVHVRERRRSDLISLRYVTARAPYSLVRHALARGSAPRGPNEASRKMMLYWDAQREREVQRDSGGDRRDTLRCRKAGG